MACTTATCDGSIGTGSKNFAKYPCFRPTQPVAYGCSNQGPKGWPVAKTVGLNMNDTDERRYESDAAANGMILTQWIRHCLDTMSLNEFPRNEEAEQTACAAIGHDAYQNALGSQCRRCGLILRSG